MQRSNIQFMSNAIVALLFAANAFAASKLNVVTTTEDLAAIAAERLAIGAIVSPDAGLTAGHEAHHPIR